MTKYRYMKNNNAKIIIVAVLIVLAVLVSQVLFGRKTVQNDKKTVSFEQIANIGEMPSGIPNLPVTEKTIDGSKAAETVETENITIDFGDGKVLNGETRSNTVYGCLVEFAGKNNLSVEVKNFKYGNMVVKIGETANAGSSYWSYSVNGKPGMISAERYIVYPGFKIEWKYIK